HLLSLPALSSRVFTVCQLLFTHHPFCQSPVMDIFALPKVFLRKLMRTMTIRDRLMLRITCRDFEKIVAESHAGYFDLSSIDSYPVTHKIVLSLHHAQYICYVERNECGQCVKIGYSAEFALEHLQSRCTITKTI
ncbi:hypothetical protein PMAYCL1PPCAC_21212, partial [Pristionchus mayeri]